MATVTKQRDIHAQAYAAYHYLEAPGLTLFNTNGLPYPRRSVRYQTTRLLSQPTERTTKTCYTLWEKLVPWVNSSTTLVRDSLPICNCGNVQSFLGGGAVHREAVSQGDSTDVLRSKFSAVNRVAESIHCVCTKHCDVMQDECKKTG